MKQRSCPYAGEHCYSYGECEDCEWGKIIEKNKRLKKKVKNLKAKLEEAEKTIKEYKENASKRNP